MGKDPRHFKALFNRGFSYDKLANFEAAIADYSAAICLDSTNAFAYYNRCALNFFCCIFYRSFFLCVDSTNAFAYYNRCACACVSMSMSINVCIQRHVEGGLSAFAGGSATTVMET